MQTKLSDSNRTELEISNGQTGGKFPKYQKETTHFKLPISQKFVLKRKQKIF